MEFNIEYGVPKQSVLGGLTTVRAERKSPGVFERHGKVQQIVFGEFDNVQPIGASAQVRAERLMDTAEAFLHAGVQTRISTDIAIDLSGAVSRMGRLVGVETLVHDIAALAIRLSSSCEEKPSKRQIPTASSG